MMLKLLIVFVQWLLCVQLSAADSESLGGKGRRKTIKQKLFISLTRCTVHIELNT